MKTQPVLYHWFAWTFLATSLCFGQAQETMATFHQSLQRAAFIGVGRVAAGVQKDENERALWRIVTIEKKLLDRTTPGLGISQTWYAPMDDLGTDDYCVLIVDQIEGTSGLIPPSPNEKLSHDRRSLREHSSEKVMILHQVKWAKLIVHPTKQFPLLEEAISDGFILVCGQKIMVKELASLARTPDTKPAGRLDEIEQGGAGQPATAPESKPESNDKPQPESKPAPR